jgi:hypothetical protein
MRNDIADEDIECIQCLYRQRHAGSVYMRSDPVQVLIDSEISPWVFIGLAQLKLGDEKMWELVETILEWGVDAQ